MQQSVLIIITGMPGTGKTTLGKALSAKYKMPFISKDALKDRMFDALGWSDNAWSLKVSAAAHRIMDDIVAQELQAGHSVIVESNFKPEIDSERFRKMQEKYQCKVVQVLCWAEGETVYQRFMARIGTEARHAGHVEAVSPEQIRQEFIDAYGKDTPLSLGDVTVELDTTNTGAIDYTSVYDAIDSQIAA